MSWRRRCLAWAIAWTVRAWIATLRVERRGAVHRPAVFAFWHGEQLALLAGRPSGRLIAPMSLSRDGRFQARIMGRLGIEDAPGSSSRGGAGAARRLLRALKAGAVALMAVDGPRGPREVAKPGARFLADRVGVPIQPIGLAVRRGRRLRSWDRFLLPLPFTRVVIVYGAPLAPGEALDAGIQAATAAARAALA